MNAEVPTQEVTRAQAARFARVSYGTIASWERRGLIRGRETPFGTLFTLREVSRVAAKQRREKKRLEDWRAASNG